MRVDLENNQMWLTAGIKYNKLVWGLRKKEKQKIRSYRRRNEEMKIVYRRRES